MNDRGGLRSKWAAPLALLFALAPRCSGGSAGLPPIPVTPLRVIQAAQPTDGSLASVADPHLQAIPVSGAVVSGTIMANVAIEVPVDQTYFLEVTDGPTPSRAGGTLVGNVVFASGVDSPDTSALFVSKAEAPIDLGELRLTAGRISPSTNPLDFVDANQNGIPDSQEPNADPLRVLRVEPADGEVDVARDEEIEVRFSLAVDASTVNDGTIRLEGPSGAVSIVTQNESEADDDAGRLEIAARDPLDANTRYTLVVTTGVLSTDGRALGAEFRSTFTTGTSIDDGSEDADRSNSGGGGVPSDDGSVDDGAEDDGHDDDGNVDDGAADDGHDDDGSVGDGAEDDGHDDGGSIDDGAEDDGHDDGGSVDDGAEDDGHDDGGSVDDGAEDDGHDDGGSIDDGGEDDGSSEDGADEPEECGPTTPGYPDC